MPKVASAQKPAPSSKPLNKALAKIPVLSQQLNKIADDAVSTVRQVEDFLEKAHLGSIDCAVGIEQDEDSVYNLEYRRYGPKFRIVIVYYDNSPPPDNVEVKPFSDHSRDMKLKAFQRLPDLIDKIAASLESIIKQSKETTQSVLETIGFPEKIDTASGTSSVRTKPVVGADI